MGACCSSTKAASEPEKRNEMVKSDVKEEKINNTGITTHNVMTTVENTAVVSENSTLVTNNTSSNKSTYDSPRKVVSTLPPLSPNRTNSNLTVTTQSTEHSEPSPSSSSRNSESLLMTRTSSSRPRVLSSDISSRSSFTSTKKDNREFRFFLPYLEDSDYEWIDSDIASSYTAALHALVTALRNEEGDEPTIEDNWKEDTFIAGKSYFSLRYLDDKKLEMRVKTENTPIWMEKWSKVRFGKKAISHYRADIISYLHDVGHKDPSIEKIIDEPQVLTIKRRDISATPELGIELSEIEVPQVKQNDVDGDVKCRRWLTFGMAADSNKIQEFLYSHIDGSGASGSSSLWSVVELAHSIVETQCDAAAQRRFAPVVSGYAVWVRLVLGQLNTPDVVKSELFPALDSFQHFLGGDESS